MILGLTAVTMFPPHSEAVSLIQQWNDFLKTQLQHQLGGDTLQGWGEVPLYILNQHTLGSVSPIARINGSKNQGV